MKEMLKKVVALSQDSTDKGRFPAGALVVKENEIIKTSVSGQSPQINNHAESTAIDEAIKDVNEQLTEYTLYTTMEPCLMCIGKIYWSGIRKVVYILAREDVDTALSYEGDHNTQQLLESFNESVELVQDKSLHKEALEVYKNWEVKVKSG